MNADPDMRTTSTTAEARDSECTVHPRALGATIIASFVLATIGLVAVLLGLWLIVSDLLVRDEWFDGLGVALGSTLAAIGAAAVAAFGVPARTLHRRRAAGAAPSTLRVPLRVVTTLAYLLAAAVVIPTWLQLGLTVASNGFRTGSVLAATAATLFLAGPPALLGAVSRRSLARE